MIFILGLILSIAIILTIGILSWIIQQYKEKGNLNSSYLKRLQFQWIFIELMKAGFSPSKEHILCKQKWCWFQEKVS